MVDRNIFSARFGILRDDFNVTMVDVANALAISKQSVHQWATGKNVPSTDTLIALADYFNVSLDYLVGRTDEPALSQSREDNFGLTAYTGA